MDAHIYISQQYTAQLWEKIKLLHIPGTCMRLEDIVLSEVFKKEKTNAWYLAQIYIIKNKRKGWDNPHGIKSKGMDNRTVTGMLRKRDLGYVEGRLYFSGNIVIGEWQGQNISSSTIVKYVR